MQLRLWNRDPGRPHTRRAVYLALVAGWVAGVAFLPSVNMALDAALTGMEDMLAEDESNAGGTGTGFVISSTGHVLTNAHVVNGCGSITARIGGEEQELALLATDPANDLAVLKLEVPLPHFAGLRAYDARLAEPVIVTGYPMQDMLSSTIHVTTGEVSSLAGMGDNTSSFQTSAPFQHGSSGSPVLDQASNVIGVAYALLDSEAMLENGDDIPQNVGFVIKASVVRSFLESNAIGLDINERAERLDTEAIAAEADRYTLAVTCEQ